MAKWKIEVYDSCIKRWTFFGIEKAEPELEALSWEGGGLRLLILIVGVPSRT